MEIILLLFVIAIGIAVFGVLIYYSTRRGEKCRGMHHRDREEEG